MTTCGAGDFFAHETPQGSGRVETNLSPWLGAPRRGLANQSVVKSYRFGFGVPLVSCFFFSGSGSVVDVLIFDIPFRDISEKKR